MVRKLQLLGYKVKELWQTESLVEEFKNAGGDAIEVVSGSQGRAFTEHCARWARKYGLYGSVGSDFHSNSGNATGSRPKPGEQGQLPNDVKSVMELLVD